MRPILVLGWGLVVLTSCNNTPRFDAVSIRPIYGWTDGCVKARISGHGFSDNVTATLTPTGGSAVPMPADPTGTAGADADKGFWFERQVPAGPKGFADVNVDNGDGQTDVLKKAWYWVECPGVAVDALADEADGTVAAGDTITVRGCGLTTDLFAKIGDAAPVALTQTCGAGVATFAAPAQPAGDYLVTFVDSTGTLVYPQPCDTADTGSPCVQLPVTYGGT